MWLSNNFAVSTPAQSRSVNRMVVCGVAVIELVMAIILFPMVNRAHVAHTDFVNFYAAGTLVREGHGRFVYRDEYEAPIVDAILERKVSGFFLHPPFEAAAFVPLSYLPIERAFVVWTLFNTALLGFLPLVLGKSVAMVARRPYFGLLVFVFPPAVICLTLGQDSIMVLFVMSLAYLLYSRKKAFSGGLILSLASVKFQFVVILGILLLCSRKVRVVAGVIAGCTLLVAASFVISGAAGIVEYVRYLRTIDIHNGNVYPELMVNLRGFLGAIAPALNVRPYSMAGGILLVGFGILCARRFRATLNRALEFSLFIAIAVVASPYTHFADATILALPLFLATNWSLSAKVIRTSEKLILVSCALLFVTPIVLMSVFGHFWWNSRIYLMFPVISFFIASLAAAMYANSSRDDSNLYAT